MANHEANAQKIRGILFIIGGILLLLYSLGFIQTLGSTILIIVSVFLIISGFIESGLYRLVLPGSNK